MPSRAARRSTEPRAVCVLVSCEHATNHVPAAYRPLFRGAGAVLASHRGYDHGAATLAKHMARALHAELLMGRATRLLADLNRHAHALAALSEFSKQLTADEQRRMLARWHTPYRAHAAAWVTRALADGARVVHVSCHSFTPRLDGEIRHADVGLLYDPQRPLEVALVRAWRAAIADRCPELRLRRNYPYRGVADGLTQYLRKHAPAGGYAGIEIEINQRITRGPRSRWQQMRAMLCETAAIAIGGMGGTF